MPTKNPRINLVVEKPLYGVIHNLAEDEGVSMGTVVKDLIKEALELREDLALAYFAEEREKTFDESKAMTHKEVWG
jgi:predicted DNA-binding protein